MRAASVAAVATLVLLAGCSALPAVGGDGADDPVVTAVPDDQIPSEPPPGVASLRVVNPDALGGAHAASIEDESYVLTSNRTVVYENGTLRSRLAVRVAVDDDGGFLATASTRGPEAPVFLGRPPADATYWSNGTTNARRLHRDGTTTYTRYDPRGTWVGSRSYWTTSVAFGGRASRPEAFFSSLFSVVPTRVTGERALDGTAVFRLENEADRPFSDDTFPGPVESVHDVTFVALVDADGLVRSLDLRYAGTVDGEPVRVERTVRYEDVGSTAVDRPPWFDRTEPA